MKDLCGRYRQSQIKAAVKVNVEQLKFNWLLGRDIVELHVEERWGESVITQLSKDLREAIPNAAGLSKSNIYYCRKFYLLYKDALKTFHQLGGKNETEWRCVVMHDAPLFLFITIQICSLSLSCDLLKISLIYVFPASKNSSCKLIKQFNQPVHTLFCQFCTHLFYIEGNG